MSLLKPHQHNPKKRFQNQLKEMMTIGINTKEMIQRWIQTSFIQPQKMDFHPIMLTLEKEFIIITKTIALKLKIPLIIWGENSASEYGGDDELKGVRLNRKWLMKYGVTNGTSHSDWIGTDLSEQDLAPYVWPSDDEQENVGVKAVFLGHYFKWDPTHTFEIAQKHGFISADKAKTGYYAFADIDDEFLITIHHWIKWYKFGFTRLWDNLSLEIRNKRITRKQAIDIIVEAGNELPLKEISDFCHYIKITEKRFFEIMESFRNKNIWKQDKISKWYLKNFLVDNWKW